jgi:hypothetical protein
MSYLDNTTITLDANFTKRGRELFSQGKFNVTKFALSDDEIDYKLYDTSHPSGSDYYAIAIENLPMLEAIPDGNKIMKYKLITLPKGTAQIPLISVGTTSVRLRAATTTYPGESITITPSTVNGLNETLGYTATLYNSQYVDLLVGQSVSSITPGQEEGTFTSDAAITNNTPLGISKIGKSFILKAKRIPNTNTTFQTTLVIVGNETGGSVAIDVRVYSDSSIGINVSE